MKHFYQTVEGWFDFSDIYDEAIRRAKENDILVETGTFHGKSAAYMIVEATNSGKKLQCFTIDIDKSKSKMLNELFEGTDMKYVCEDSLKAAKKFKDKSIHMIFLDSSHEFSFVEKELRAWYPKLKDGGIFAGHDWNDWNEVCQAVDKFAKEVGRTVVAVGSSWKFI